MSDSISRRGPAASPSASPSAPTTVRQWLAVAAVSIGAFAFVTAEYLPVGLLPQIAGDLGISPGTAGLMITAPAVFALVFAPLLMVLAGRMNRRQVFIGLTALLLASNLVGAAATNFATMLAGRALLGAALGGFWTLATAAAGRLVQPADAARATAAILGGVTLATVIGVPLSTLIAGLASWRAAFGATAALVAVALLLQMLFVPSLPSAEARRASEFVALFRRPSTRLCMMLVALIFGAHFSTYTYIAPWLERNFSAQGITGLLFAFGIVGFVANGVGSMFVARRLMPSIALMTLLLLAAIVAMLLFAHSRAGETAGVVLWGIAFGGLPLCCSLLIQRETADMPEIGAAVMVSVIQAAIAFGSSVGGRIVDGAGVPADFAMGCVLALGGLVVLWRLAALAQPNEAARASAPTPARDYGASCQPD